MPRTPRISHRPDGDSDLSHHGPCRAGRILGSRARMDERAQKLSASSTARRARRPHRPQTVQASFISKRVLSGHRIPEATMRLIHALRPAAALAACFHHFCQPASRRGEVHGSSDHRLRHGLRHRGAGSSPLFDGVTSEAEIKERSPRRQLRVLMQKVTANGLKEKAASTPRTFKPATSTSPRYDTSKSNTYHQRLSGSGNPGLEIRPPNLGGLLDKLVSLRRQSNARPYLREQSRNPEGRGAQGKPANARRRAELLATAAGASVGEVVSIAEEVSWSRPAAADGDVEPRQGGISCPSRAAPKPSRLASRSRGS